MSSRPPLSVVIPARGGPAEAADALSALTPHAEGVGAEVVVVGDSGGVEPPSESVRVISTPEADILALRKLGMEAARGEVVAVGEDHAVPRPDWCEAVIRAHAEHPEAAAIAGCLVNATDATLAGRANFLAFASAWQPPMPTLPPGRPPPSSVLSFKRDALEGIASEPPGWLEADLIPSLFEQGLMSADERVVADHHQDHGCWWSVYNGFDSARSSYGFKRSLLTPARRREVARWAFLGIPRQMRSELRGNRRSGRAGAAEAALIGAIQLANGLGGVAGTLLGPGRSPDRLA